MFSIKEEQVPRTSDERVDSFSPEEDQAGRNRVVVLSYGFWQRVFGGDPSALGRRVMVVDANQPVRRLC